MTTGQLVTIEGMLISVDSASSFTPQQVEGLVRQSARNLEQVGPCTVVRLQDLYSSQCTASALRSSDGKYSNYKANVYLSGKTSTTFSSQPEAQTAHEYGHAYTLRAYYLVSARNWTPYLKARGLDADTRVGSSYAWTPQEIAGDDYRLLFGSTKAISQRPKHMNRYIQDPREVKGLKDWMANWGG